MAAQSWRLLVSLPRCDRAAIQAIRQACAVPQEIETSPLQGLVALCKTRALRIGAQGSTFVTPDERLLLAGLSARQQLSKPIDDFTCPHLATALTDGAVGLAGLGIRPTGNAARLALLREQGWITSAQESAVRAGNRGNNRPAREGTAKWSVIEHARGRPAVSSTELQALGITRQYISMLHRSGVLERVAFGHYRLGSSLAGTGLADRYAG
jgi:hypothetical protein